MSKIQPLFLISLPRSGSTLLQKMLTVHPDIYSIAEPWILLPLAGLDNNDLIVSRYWHRTCSSAFKDLINELPEKKKEYNKIISEFALNIYESLSKNSDARYFLDKTPRYYLILPFIKEIFPKSKVIFLARNPLDVYASILKTWHHDFINPTLMANYIDLIMGPELMAAGMESYKSAAHIIHYEKMISDTETVLRQLCEFLEIEFLKEMLTDYKKIEYSGKMGDAVGINKYDKISTESIETWKPSVNSPFRKWYLKRYINKLGAFTLKSFDIDRDTILNELDNISVQLWRGWGEVIGYLSLNLVLRMNKALIGPHNSKSGLFSKKPPVPYG